MAALPIKSLIGDLNLGTSAIPERLQLVMYLEDKNETGLKNVTWLQRSKSETIEIRKNFTFCATN